MTSELRLFKLADPGAARSMRHALASFLNALEVESDAADDILMAVGEALANAVEHAYGEKSGEIELYAWTSSDHVLGIEVADHGRFIDREPRPGRGFGLRIVRTVAREVTLDTDKGTRVRMRFDLSLRRETARQA